MLNTMVWVWLGTVALTLVLEAVTMSLVSVWLSVGALIAVFAAYCGLAIPAQMLIFIGVSIAAFFAVRPLTRRFINPHITPTNADRLLGLDARVTEKIDNTVPAGAVYVDGKVWTARSAEGEIIPAGETVEVAWMEGIKLFVRPKTAVPVS